MIREERGEGEGGRTGRGGGDSLPLMMVSWAELRGAVASFPPSDLLLKIHQHRSAAQNCSQHAARADSLRDSMLQAPSFTRIQSVQLNDMRLAIPNVPNQPQQ